MSSANLREQYNQYWQNSKSASMAWVALLFAVLRVAVLSWQRASSTPPDFQGRSPDMLSSYRASTISALMAADHTKPQPHLIESLTLHLYAEYASVADVNANVWVLLAMIVRLAMRMGYHRRQQPASNISPFQAEMRRRVWTYLGIADIMFSFQVGLRGMIKLSDIMVNIPSNIHDDHDFDEHTETLPASLAPTEVTGVSFMIAKARLALGFGKMLQELSGEHPLPYDRVLDIDKQLRQSYNSVPEHYKLHTMSQESQSPLSLTASRFMLANLHHKSICVLHSRYLSLARFDQRFLYSRRSCLEATMRLLGFQAIQHEQSVACGSMFNLNEYQTSLTTHDFLLAATLVSVELSLDHGKSPFEGRSDAGPSRKELVEALDRSVHIWLHLRDRSVEAYKAADVLSMFLAKCKKQDDARASAMSNRSFEDQPADATHAAVEPQHLSWWHGDAGVTKNAGAQGSSFEHLMGFNRAYDGINAFPDTAQNVGHRISSNANAVEQSPYNEADGMTWSLSGSRLSSGVGTGPVCYSQNQNSWSSYSNSIDFSDPLSTMWSLNSDTAWLQD